MTHLKDLLRVLSLLALFFSLSFVPLNISQAQTTQEVKMSMEQFNSLRQTTKLLKENYNKQESEIKTLKTQLTDSQTSLQRANSYLTDYKQNLTKLQSQTDSLLKENKTMEKQRNVAWIVAGGLLVWGCSR